MDTLIAILVVIGLFYLMENYKVEPVYLILGGLAFVMIYSCKPKNKERFQDTEPFEATLRIDDKYVNVADGIGECKRGLILADKPMKFYFAPVGNNEYTITDFDKYNYLNVPIVDNIGTPGKNICADFLAESSIDNKALHFTLEMFDEGNRLGYLKNKETYIGVENDVLVPNNQKVIFKFE